MDVRQSEEERLRNILNFHAERFRLKRGKLDADSVKVISLQPVANNTGMRNAIYYELYGKIVAFYICSSGVNRIDPEDGLRRITDYGLARLAGRTRPNHSGRKPFLKRFRKREAPANNMVCAERQSLHFNDSLPSPKTPEGSGRLIRFESGIAITTNRTSTVIRKIFRFLRIFESIQKTSKKVLS